VGVSFSGRQFSYIGDRFSPPSLPGGGRGQPAPLLITSTGQRLHAWAILRGRCPLATGVSLPRQPGTFPSSGGSSTPPTSPAAAVSLPLPPVNGWWDFSASFLRCFFRVPPPRHWSQPTACNTSFRQWANQLPPNSGGWMRHVWLLPSWNSSPCSMGYHLPIVQSMEQSASNGPKEGRLMAALRRLPPIEPVDGGGQMPSPQHG
jgi:hypothetical protein